MGRITKPKKVKLICGLIYAPAINLARVFKILTQTFSPLDFESEAIPFNFTNYYQKEMGKNLRRKFVTFRDLIEPDKLKRAKSLTNQIEAKFLSRGGRTINLDPGYVDTARLVLATTKDYSHRIYLGGGIFAEVTLDYRNGAFMPREWTYPDYETGEYIKIFNQIREIYAQQISKK